MKENLLNRPTGALPHSVVSNITDEGKLERQERAIGQDKLLLLHKENILLGDIPLFESRKELTRQKAKFRSGSGTESRFAQARKKFLYGALAAFIFRLTKEFQKWFKIERLELP